MSTKFRPSFLLTRTATVRFDELNELHEAAMIGVRPKELPVLRATPATQWTSQCLALILHRMESMGFDLSRSVTVHTNLNLKQLEFKQSPHTFWSDVRTTLVNFWERRKILAA